MLKNNIYDYILISSASKDEKYLRRSNYFINRLQELDINNYEIEYIDLPKDMNCWLDKYDSKRIKKELICLQKPKIIKDKLKKHNKPIISIDIDSYLLSKPILPKRDFDIAFIFRPRKLLSVTNGFHIWKPTDYTYRFLDMWIYLCDWPGLTYLTDHHRLHHLINMVNEEQKIKSINWECQIINVFEEYKDLYIEGLIRQNDDPSYKTLSGNICKIKKGVNWEISRVFDHRRQLNV